LKNHIVRPTKIAIFLAYKCNNLLLYPTIVTEKQEYLNSEGFLAPPYLTAPRTPGLDRPPVANVNELQNAVISHDLINEKMSYQYLRQRR